MRSEYEMKKLLSEIGIKDVFDSNKSDLSGIGEGLYVTGVYHEAYVKVNEEGTEAAAATGAVLKIKSARPSPSFICDHPFMFRIIENKFGAILFQGIVANPL